MQVRFVLEALCVDFVDVLCTRRTRSEPAAPGHDFQPADGSLVTRSLGQLGNDAFAREIGFSDSFGRKLLQLRLLFRGSRRVDARVIRSAEFCSQLAVVFSGILASARGD